MGVPFISHKEGVMPVYWMNDNQPLRFTERFDLSFPPRKPYIYYKTASIEY